MISFDRIRDVDSLEEALSDPYPEDLEAAAMLGGDLLVLGAAGKMGPTLVRRAVRAVREAGEKWNVFAVSRFSNRRALEKIETWGGIPITCDLLESTGLDELPDCPNVLFLAGVKFGTEGNEPLTWATNSYLPGCVARRYRRSRIVALSTGNVYPFVSPKTGGSAETDPVGPVGEYGQSCLGRERVFEYFSRRQSTLMCLIRLNYAVEARYGVLLDLASKVFRREPVPLGVGYFNVVWQGDANSFCLRAFSQCKNPPGVLNVTGPELLSVRQVALEFGRLFGVEVRFKGKESRAALLSNAGRCFEVFGPPRVLASEVITLVAEWVRSGGPTLNRATRFEVSDGRF